MVRDSFSSGNRVNNCKQWSRRQRYMDKPTSHLHYTVTSIRCLWSSCKRNNCELGSYQRTVDNMSQECHIEIGLLIGEHCFKTLESNKVIPSNNGGPFVFHSPWPPPLARIFSKS